VRKLLLVLCVVGLALAGCGGDDESANKKPAPQPSSSGGGGGNPSVVMKNIQFAPASVTVKKGGTVKWTNDDSVGHDVTKKGGPGPKFSSGSAGGMQSGDTFQQKFTTAGTIQYVCTVHPNMKGTITVK
jgi:plastocyanin